MNLPNELVTKIIQCLSFQERNRIRTVCKLINALVTVSLKCAKTLSFDVKLICKRHVYQRKMETVTHNIHHLQYICIFVNEFHYRFRLLDRHSSPITFDSIDNLYIQYDTCHKEFQTYGLSQSNFHKSLILDHVYQYRHQNIKGCNQLILGDLIIAKWVITKEPKRALYCNNTIQKRLNLHANIEQLEGFLIFDYLFPKSPNREQFCKNIIICNHLTSKYDTLYRVLHTKQHSYLLMARHDLIRKAQDDIAQQDLFKENEDWVTKNLVNMILYVQDLNPENALQVN